jgi:hypothetical protein
VRSTCIHHIAALPALADRRQSEYAVPAAIQGACTGYLYLSIYLSIYLIIIIIMIIGYNTLIIEVLRAVLQARLW